MKDRIKHVLVWTQKYTRTDMLYLTKGSFWLMLGHFIYMASGLITAVAFANLLTQQDLGTYQFIMSMSAVISIFTLSGMSTAVMRSAAKGSEGALRSGFNVSLKWSLGMVLIGGALALYYYINDNLTLFYSFLIIGSTAPFLNASRLTKSYLLGKKMFRENVLLGLWRRLIPIAAVLITILLTQNVVILVLIYFLSNTLSALLLYKLVISKYSLVTGEEEEMIAYSKHLSLIKIFTEIVGHADKLLVWFFLGANSMAVYTIAQLPIKHIEGLFKLAYPLTFPKINAYDFPKLQQLLPQKVRIFTLLAALVVVVYILVAPFFFSLLFPKYLESILLSQALILILLSKPRQLYVQAFISHKKTKQQYLISISASILKLVLLFVLLPLYGLWGVVYAILGTHLYINILVRYLFSTVK